MLLAGPDRFRSWGALLCLVVPINLIMAIDKNSFALAAPQIGTALGLSYAEISQAIAAVMLSYALMQVPSGWLVQSFGPRRVLGVACLLW